MGDSVSQEQEQISFHELFIKQCPYYLSIGMTLDEFWHGDPYLTVLYRRSHELERKRKNEELWLQGRYIYEALCDASPLFRFTMQKGTIKAEPYRSEPIPITEEEKRALEEREAKAKMERMKAQFMEYTSNLKLKRPEMIENHESKELEGTNDVGRNDD